MKQLTVDILFLKELLEYFEVLRRIYRSNTISKDEDSAAMAEAIIDMAVDQLNLIIEDAEI